MCSISSSYEALIARRRDRNADKWVRPTFQGCHTEPAAMPGDQLAILEYLQWTDVYKSEKPYEVLINLPYEKSQLARTNLAFAPVERRIEDVGGRESGFNLDTHGFCWRRHITSVVDFKNRDVVVDHYLPEMESFIRGQTGEVTKVFIFDWRAC